MFFSPPRNEPSFEIRKVHALLPPYSLTMSWRWSGERPMPLGLLMPPATECGRVMFRAFVGTPMTWPAPVSVK